jgi:CheY-like chemotaxis protein
VSRPYARKILIVDDEVDITTAFKLGLGEAVELQVDVYNDPLLALSDYKPGIYDLLLLDIKMPKMDGFELYKKIKDKEKKMIDQTTDKVDDKPNVCFITAYDEGNYSQFKESFPILEKDNCFLRKPVLLNDFVKKGKITIMFAIAGK